MQPEPPSDVNTEHHPWSFLEKKTEAQNKILELNRLHENCELRLAKERHNRLQFWLTCLTLFLQAGFLMC